MAVQGPVNRLVADHRKHHAQPTSRGTPTVPCRHRSGLGESSPSSGTPTQLADVEPGPRRLESTRGGSLRRRGERKISRNFVPLVSSAYTAGARRLPRQWKPSGCGDGILGRPGADSSHSVHHVTLSSLCVSLCLHRRFDQPRRSLHNVFWLALPIPRGESCSPTSRFFHARLPRFSPR